MQLDERNVSTHLMEIFGFKVKESDLVLIRHFIVSTETLIKNFCHVSKVPQGAVHPAIEHICGKFLKHKFETGTLTDDEGNPLYTFSSPEASVTVGDVSVSYESGYGSIIDDNAFLGLVNELADEHNFKLKIVHFRRVKWPRY